MKKKKLLNYGKQKKKYQNILLSLINNQNLVSLKNPRSIEFNIFFPFVFFLRFVSFHFCRLLSNKYPEKSKHKPINFDADDVCALDLFLKIQFLYFLEEGRTENNQNRIIDSWGTSGTKLLWFFPFFYFSKAASARFYAKIKGKLNFPRVGNFHRRRVCFLDSPNISPDFYSISMAFNPRELFVWQEQKKNYAFSRLINHKTKRQANASLNQSVAMRKNFHFSQFEIFIFFFQLLPFIARLRFFSWSQFRFLKKYSLKIFPLLN